MPLVSFALPDDTKYETPSVPVLEVILPPSNVAFTNEILVPDVITVLPFIELDNVIVVPLIEETFVSEGIPVPIM